MSAPHPHVSFRWAAGDGEYLGVSVQPELIRGQLRCRSLVVTAEDNNDVTSEVLRTIPIGRLTQLAADALGLGWTPPAEPDATRAGS